MVEILFAYGLAGYYSEDRFTLKNLSKYNTVRWGTIVLAVILFWQSYMGVISVMREVDTNFSDGKGAAEFLMENHLEHKILVGHTSWAASSVLQQLPADCKMYYPDCQRWGTYLPFDSLYEANQYKFGPDYAPFIAEQKFKDSLK